jgi:hypothetical protein
MRSKRHIVNGMAMATALVLAACGAQTESGTPTWEEFEDQSTRVVDGKSVHVLEGDIAVTREELRAYYDQVVLEKEVDGEAVGQQGAPLAVNLINGLDDIWAPEVRFNLTYCVSDEFGADKPRAVAEMAAAEAAWEGVAAVGYTYDPTHDAACNGDNLAVTFAVRPWSSGGACAFFPSGGGCIPRTVVIDYVDFDTNPQWDDLAPNMTTGGVLIHELGHTLGFRHEHIRVPDGCLEDTNWRELTPYDPGSTMHYPWCPGGQVTSTLQLTPVDAQGAAAVYGAPGI